MRAQTFWNNEGVIVRGTDDPRKARTEALRGLMNRDDEGYPPAAVCTGDAWIEIALHYARLLRDIAPRTGTFRWTPCNPKSCYEGVQHSGHLQSGVSAGPGAWPGVYWWEI
ncbi:MAG TPA: hypothetical protein VFM86_10585 [Pedococcus sp.]|nr:hypothetical protein [Pedococcus sp.]